MRRLISFLAVLFVLFSFNTITPVYAQEDKIIYLRADEWCPYNCADDAEKLGYMVDIAKAIFEPLGYRIDYKTLNWSRSIYQARQGKYHGIVGAYKSDAKDFIFPEKSLGYATNTLFSLNNSSFIYNNLYSLIGLRIGIIKDYSYGDNIDKFIADSLKNDPNSFQVLYGNDPLTRNIKSLYAHRIDAIIEDNAVMRYKIKLDNLEGIQPKVTLSSVPVYIAFSPAREDSTALAQILSEGITKLRESGQLHTLLAEYNIQDWQE